MSPWPALTSAGTWKTQNGVSFHRPGITPLELEWPPGFYSLAHVAVPFPPDDPVYGTHPDPRQHFGIQLGTLEPRGEKGLMVISGDQFLRLRSNPFFPYIEQRLIDLSDAPSPPESEPTTE